MKKGSSPRRTVLYVIERAYEQAGCGVVVLVDEYDTLAASPRQ